ncbi:MAG: signal peptidase I [Acidimicrobiia bacterium]|nr:signal peptidase I [Acidimicrobiia bacterium]
MRDAVQVDGGPGTEPAPSRAHAPPAPSPGRRYGGRFAREAAGVLFLAVVVAVLVKVFLVQAFFIPSESMIPTLEIDDRVLVSRIAYVLDGPDRGEVIVFDMPMEHENPPEPIWESMVRHVVEAVGIRVARVEDLIKRVIAVGGDRLEVRDNRVVVNGLVLEEPYVPPGARMADLGPVYIPDGHVWVMGDNRDNSRDSRSFGPVPVDTIVGRAFIRFWPVSRLEGL